MGPLHWSNQPGSKRPYLARGLEEEGRAIVTSRSFSENNSFCVFKSLIWVQSRYLPSQRRHLGSEWGALICHNLLWCKQQEWRRLENMLIALRNNNITIYTYYTGRLWQAFHGWSRRAKYLYYEHGHQGCVRMAKCKLRQDTQRRTCRRRRATSWIRCDRLFALVIKGC